jgi:hypothetical protein
VIYARQARYIVKDREAKERREAARKLEPAQKVNAFEKKRRAAFKSAVWQEFQRKRTARRHRKEDWGPIWKCIKRREHPLYDNMLLFAKRNMPNLLYFTDKHIQRTGPASLSDPDENCLSS